MNRSGRAGVCAAVVLALAAGLPARAQEGAGEPDPALRSYLSGNGLLGRGMDELAAKEYRDFLSAHPGHEKAPVARYGLGVALFRMKQYDEAATELSRLRGNSGFDYAAEVSLLLAQCDLVRTRYAQAAEGLESLLKEHPSHDTADDAAALLAEARYREGKFEQVAESCRLLVEKWPASPLRERAELFWGMADMARRDYAAAADRLAGLAKRSPESPSAEQATLLAAQCLHNAGKLDEAAALYKKVLDRPKGRFTPDALYGLGSVLRQRGKPADAGALLDRLAEEFPESELAGSARLERARAWFDQEKYDQASAALEQAREAKAPADHVAYWLAKCELRTDRAAAAAKRLRSAIRAHPESAILPEMTYDRAVAQLRAGDQAGAADTLSEFASRFPDHALATDAAETLAGIEHAAGNYDKSLALCTAFLEKSAGHPRAAAVEFLAAENQYMAGRLDAAADAYRAFLSAHPKDDNRARAEFRLGMALYRQEKYDDARPLLAKVARGRETEPAFRPAVLCLGDLSFQRGEWKQAESLLSDYLSFGPGTPSADDAALKLGLCMQRQGRHQEALKQYDRLLEDFPDSQHRIQATFERGQALLALEKPDEAAEAFKTVIEQDRSGRFAPYARSHLGGLSLASKDFAAAAEQFDRAAAAAGDDAARGEAVFQKGQALLAAQRYADAAAAFGSLVDEQPSHPRAPLAAAQRAIALARVKRDAAALREIDSALSRAADVEPATRDALSYERGCCLRETGDTDGAAAAFRELAGRGQGPLAPYATLDLAALESDAGRFKEASELLTRLRRPREGAPLPPDVAEGAAYRLAICEYRLERPKQAAALLEEFLTAYPKSSLIPAATVLAGECQFLLGRHDEAVRHFRRVLDEFPQESASIGPSMLRLGESLAAIHDWAESERVYSRYLERFGDTELWFQARFGQAWAMENAGRHAQAIDAYRRVVDKHQGPTAARAQFQIGECLFAQGKHEEAIRELLKVDILYGYPEWSAAALYEAGRCFQAMSKPKEAAEQFKQVKDKYPATDWARLASEQLASLSSIAR